VSHAAHTPGSGPTLVTPALGEGGLGGLYGAGGALTPEEGAHPHAPAAAGTAAKARRKPASGGRGLKSPPGPGLLGAGAWRWGDGIGVGGREARGGRGLGHTHHCSARALLAGGGRALPPPLSPLFSARPLPASAVSTPCPPPPVPVKKLGKQAGRGLEGAIGGRWWPRMPEKALPSRLTAAFLGVLVFPAACAPGLHNPHALPPSPLHSHPRPARRLPVRLLPGPADQEIHRPGRGRGRRRAGPEPSGGSAQRERREKRGAAGYAFLSPAYALLNLSLSLSTHRSRSGASTTSPTCWRASA